ncbi:hypothetical protein DH2020_047998 [Rehmannia glutinosa]|uniref:peroxidase n=1 Tax=Rehmannia glutinosa TaxID=99300 RepID=A0ABR0U7I8_REHGL
MVSTSSFLVKLTLICVLIGLGNSQLSSNFYSSTCPNLTSIIRTAVNSAVSSEGRMGASLLRLHFHDCFVNGCDASVLLDDTANFTGEKTAGPNANSLRGFNIIDNIKTQVEASCPGIVSCADILAVAARDGTVALNGPSWAVALGRRDSTTASLSAANNQIPGPNLNLNALITSFSNKGFTAREMVALSGTESTTKNSNINATFATTVRGNCPRTGGNNNLKLAGQR